MDTIWLAEGAITVDGRKVFTEGDPSPSGHPPTRITSRFLNNLMLELINLIEKAGLTPDPKSDTQVLESINKLCLYRDYDAIVGDGYYSSIPEAIESVKGSSRILIANNQTVTKQIDIDYPDITISSLPGVNIHSTSTSGSLFKLNEERITFKDLRIGFESPKNGMFIFDLTDKAKSALISNVRIYNHQNLPFFSGNLLQAGTVIE